MRSVAVVQIATGYLRYCGHCLHTAATKLEPGTCYGVADTQAQAQAMAKARAHLFMAQGYEPHEPPQGTTRD